MSNASKALHSRDRLMGANRRLIADGCVKVFDRIQGWPKEYQVLSLAAAFVLACSASGIAAQDAFTAAKNLMADPMTQSGLGVQFQAMQYHLKTETMRDA